MKLQEAADRCPSSPRHYFFMMDVIWMDPKFEPKFWALQLGLKTGLEIWPQTPMDGPKVWGKNLDPKFGLEIWPETLKNGRKD